MTKNETAPVAEKKPRKRRSYAERIAELQAAAARAEAKKRERAKAQLADAEARVRVAEERFRAAVAKRDELRAVLEDVSDGDEVTED